MSEYKGTYNPDKKRGELLKDNVSTGEYFPDRKGFFVDTPGIEDAQKKAAELNAEEAKKAIKKAKGGKVAGRLATRGYGISRK